MNINSSYLYLSGDQFPQQNLNIPNYMVFNQPNVNFPPQYFQVYYQQHQNKWINGNQPNNGFQCPLHQFDCGCHSKVFGISNPHSIRSYSLEPSYQMTYPLNQTPQMMNLICTQGPNGQLLLQRMPLLYTPYKLNIPSDMENVSGVPLCPPIFFYHQNSFNESQLMSENYRSDNEKEQPLQEKTNVVENDSSANIKNQNRYVAEGGYIVEEPE